MLQELRIQNKTNLFITTELLISATVLVFCISTNSSGQSFDALAKYKATTYKLDKLLIYRAMNGKLLCGPSYFFKSSEVQLQMALAMDKDKDGLLKIEVCFADGNHKRCTGNVTLTQWVRRNVTCKLCALFKTCKAAFYDI